MYDLDDFEKQKQQEKELEQQGQKDNSFLVPPSKFLNNQQPNKKTIERKGSLGSKIEEEENEDDDEEVRLDIPRQILEDKRASGKIANLINEQELKEEENKIAKWITQMQNSRAAFSENKSQADQSPQLTHTQLQTKLFQAEGDSFKKRSILIVKGTSNPQNNNLAEVPLTNSPSKRDSNSGNNDNPQQSAGSDSEKLSKSKANVKNRRSYFFKSNQNLEESSSLRKSNTIKSEKSNLIKPIGRIFNKIFENTKPEEEKKKSDDLDGFEGYFEDKINIVEIPTNVIKNFSQKIIDRSESVEKAKANEDRKAKQTLDEILFKRRSFTTKNLPNLDDKLKGSHIDNSNKSGDSSVELKKAQDNDSGHSKGIQIDNSKSEESPSKMALIQETNVKTRGRSNTAQVAKKNESDEIPNIALGLFEPSDNQIKKNYRLSIYNTPKTEHDAQKVIKSLWNVRKRAQNPFDANNEFKMAQNLSKIRRSSLSKKDNNTEEQEALGEYKIKIHAPENVLDVKKNSPEKDTRLIRAKIFNRPRFSLRQIRSNSPIDERSETSVSKSIKLEAKDLESEKDDRKSNVLNDSIKDNQNSIDLQSDRDFYIRKIRIQTLLKEVLLF